VSLAPEERDPLLKIDTIFSHFRNCIPSSPPAALSELPRIVKNRIPEEHNGPVPCRRARLPNLWPTKRRLLIHHVRFTIPLTLLSPVLLRCSHPLPQSSPVSVHCQAQPPKLVNLERLSERLDSLTTRESLDPDAPILSDRTPLTNWLPQ